MLVSGQLKQCILFCCDNWGAFWSYEDILIIVKSILIIVESSLIIVKDILTIVKDTWFMEAMNV